MTEGFGLNQEQNSEERKDPHSGKAITGGRREAPTGEMNIAERNGLTIGPTTTTEMILGGKVITPTRAKITGGKMDTPTEEVPKDLSTMNTTEA
jgi:hypothetical protein